jgi:hypothetical protein
MACRQAGGSAFGGKKMKTKFIKISSVLVLILICFLWGNFCSSANFEARTEVKIVYRQIDWQTYEFRASTNQSAAEIKNYLWQIDGANYYTPIVRRYFEPGAHRITLEARDAVDNAKNDAMALRINFWSLDNRELWWMAYGLFGLILLYFAVLKIFYHFERRRIRKQKRVFWDVMLENDFVEKIARRIYSARK